MSGTLVGPLPTVRFSGGPNLDWFNPPKIAYTPPKDTCDPRARACTDHHVACDCREAEFAEDRHERRAAAKELQDTIGTVLAGHATMLWTSDGNLSPHSCQCTGCQIVRAAHLSHVHGWVQIAADGTGTDAP